MESPVPILCPICSGMLRRSGRSFSCDKRHNFDTSGDGYLSLLHGRSHHQQVGDDKPMVQARVRVHKLPAFQRLARAIAGFCPHRAAVRGVLDIGCGDGFFLRHVAHEAPGPFPGVGVDISKEALGRAARSHSTLFFIRTDAAHHRLPFMDASFGIVLSIFAPRPLEEIRRVLLDEGSWLMVTATQEHLRELRPHLPLAAIGTGKLEAPTSGAFEIQEVRTFSEDVELQHLELVSMVEMSPSVYRLRRESGDTWKQHVPAELRVTLSFSLTRLCKASVVGRSMGIS